MAFFITENNSPFPVGSLSRKFSEYNHATGLLLKAATTIHIPANSCGVIPHRIKVQMVLEFNEDNVLMLVRLPGVFGNLRLLVDSGPIDIEEEICTHVFNFSQGSVRVARGECISSLVSLKVG